MHDSDVMERVLGLDAHHETDEVHIEVIDLAIQPSLAGTTVSAVRLTVGAVRPRRARPRSRS